VDSQHVSSKSWNRSSSLVVKETDHVTGKGRMAWGIGTKPPTPRQVSLSNQGSQGERRYTISVSLVCAGPSLGVGVSTQIYTMRSPERHPISQKTNPDCKKARKETVKNS
jgi:hypothetical protein